MTAAAQRLGFGATCPKCSQLMQQLYTPEALARHLGSRDLKHYCILCDYSWSAMDVEYKNLAKYLAERTA
jgi:hypothetical protein